MATQSGSNTEPPVAVAILHLEDGTSITGKSFGCHKAVEGEVCFLLLLGFNFIEIDLTVGIPIVLILRLFLQRVW